MVIRSDLALVLGQYGALTLLNLNCNNIGLDGAKKITGVLPQCKALAHLNLYGNNIGNVEAEKVLEVIT
jgi:hypothetical protein